MPLVALVCASFLSLGDPPVSNPDLTTEYRQAQAAAGRSSAEQVRLALWCEAHGLAAERVRHLALAVLADPTNVMARGLAGLVARDGRWVAPAAVAQAARTDAAGQALLADYDRRRSQTPYTADAQWALGQWASDQGLLDQAHAHFTAVTRLDPTRDLAWKRLGYKKHDGHWATDAQLAVIKLDVEAQKKADRTWPPLLEQWKADLNRPSRRAAAEANLLTVTDPRALASVARVFGTDADAPRAVQLLGQIDAPAASRMLAQLALFGASPETRRTATETLRRRDPREYAHLLIGFLARPVRFEVRPVNGPGSPGVLFVEGEKANVKRLYEPNSPIRPTDQITTDRFGQPVISRVTSFSAYSRGGRPFNPSKLYGFGSSYSDSFGSSTSIAGNLDYSRFGGTRPASVPVPEMSPQAAQVTDQLRKLVSQRELAGHQGESKFGSAQVDDVVSRFEASTVPLTAYNPRDYAEQRSVEFSLAQAQAETARSAAASQGQLDRDVANLEQQNRAITATNDRVVTLLNDATGAGLSADRNAWERWWVNTLGYAFVEGQTVQNPTFVEVVPSDYQPELTPTNVVTRSIAVNGMSCFGAGTAVQTMTGPRPIEAIRVGDLVLTQSTATGALGYHPVTVTHHNPPAPTFRVGLGDDVVVASHFHRFWIAGRGWVMARDLKPGDPVRTLGGIRTIDSVEAGRVELVYNLDIADDADFFAGASAALVHDNTLPDPRLVPFDRPQSEAKAVAAR